MDTPKRDNVGSLLYLPLFEIICSVRSNMALIYCNESQAFILFPVLVLCRRTLNKNKKVVESVMDYHFKFVDN